MLVDQAPARRRPGRLGRTDHGLAGSLLCNADALSQFEDGALAVRDPRGLFQVIRVEITDATSDEEPAGIAAENVKLPRDHGAASARPLHDRLAATRSRRLHSDPGDRRGSQHLLRPVRDQDRHRSPTPRWRSSKPATAVPISPAFADPDRFNDRVQRFRQAVGHGYAVAPAGRGRDLGHPTACRHSPPSSSRSAPPTIISRAFRLAAATGIAAGTAVWGVAGFFGIGAPFTLVPWIYGALKLAGGLYLAYLGLRLIAASFGPAAPAAQTAPGPSWAAGRPSAPGPSTTCPNVKTAAFVASLFATAMPADAPVRFGLAAVAVMVAPVWYGGVAAACAAPPMARAYARRRAGSTVSPPPLSPSFGARLALDR